MLQRGLNAAGFSRPESAGGSLRAAWRFAGFLGVVGNANLLTSNVVLMVEGSGTILDAQLDATLQRMARWTKPGGTLIVTTPNNEDLELGMIYCPVSNVFFHRWQHVRSLRVKAFAHCWTATLRRGRHSFRRFDDRISCRTIVFGEIH